MNQHITCPVCNGTCSPLEPVDFNKSCEEARGKFLHPTGTLVFYAFCSACGFCFAPELMKWTLDEFKEKIYNDDYIFVDPDYADTRPRANAKSLISMFGEKAHLLSHLDYGGGTGLLTKLLRESRWKSRSYDPFVDRNVSIKHLGKFDLITAFEVFEHVPDVHELMSNIRTLLAPTGIVFFSTLLSDGNINPTGKLNWWYASPRNGHISLFSRKSLAILAENNGLRFGSFSEGFHVFVTEIPVWANHIIKTG